MVAKACARAVRQKLFALGLWASSRPEMILSNGRWSMFGQRKHDIVNDGGTTNSVAQKHLDQQSVLLTWNGPWGAFP